VTPRLVLAVAAYGQVRHVRKRREEVQKPAGLGSLHLIAVAPHERPPYSRIIPCMLGHLDQALARRHLGEPDIVEVPRCKLSLRDTAWGSTYRADTQSLVLASLAPQSDDPDSRASSPPRAARARSLAPVRPSRGPGGHGGPRKRPSSQPRSRPSRARGVLPVIIPRLQQPGRICRGAPLWLIQGDATQLR
jgi:hypothetical protein